MITTTSEYVGPDNKVMIHQTSKTCATDNCDDIPLDLNSIIYSKEILKDIKSSKSEGVNDGNDKPDTPSESIKNELPAKENVNDDKSKQIGIDPKKVLVHNADSTLQTEDDKAKDSSKESLVDSTDNLLDSFISDTSQEKLTEDFKKEQKDGLICNSVGCFKNLEEMKLMSKEIDKVMLNIDRLKTELIDITEGVEKQENSKDAVDASTSGNSQGDVVQQEEEEPIEFDRTKKMKFEPKTEL